MIIKSLEIYGYGQFVQRKMSFNKGFTEILVKMKQENQRFKHFIHSILFGFPTKNLENLVWNLD